MSRIWFQDDKLIQSFEDIEQTFRLTETLSHLIMTTEIRQMVLLYSFPEFQIK